MCSLIPNAIIYSGIRKVNYIFWELFQRFVCPIYARHGRKFNDAFLQSYFDSCEWYQGTVEADSFNEQELNETELANRNLIAEYEAEKGYK